MKNMSEAAQRRAELKQAYPRLFASVAEIMFRHDLAGINFEGNTDEYEPEAGTVIPRLKSCHSAADVRNVIEEEFETWFGPGFVSGAPVEPMAEEIWAIWGASILPGGAV